LGKIAKKGVRQLNAAKLFQIFSGETIGEKTDTTGDETV